MALGSPQWSTNTQKWIEIPGKLVGNVIGSLSLRMTKHSIAFKQKREIHENQTTKQAQSEE